MCLSSFHLFHHPDLFMSPRRNGLALSALLVRAAIASPFFRPSTTGLGNNGGTKGSPEFWYHLTISVLLVLVGGLFAGWVTQQDLLPILTLVFQPHTRSYGTGWTPSSCAGHLIRESQRKAKRTERFGIFEWQPSVHWLVIHSSKSVTTR